MFRVAEIKNPEKTFRILGKTLSVVSLISRFDKYVCFPLAKFGPVLYQTENEHQKKYADFASEK